MRYAVKDQALGEAMLPDRVETLMRCETHLDRRLEKKLAMLMKLQEIRRAHSADGSGPAPTSGPLVMANRGGLIATGQLRSRGRNDDRL